MSGGVFFPILKSILCVQKMGRNHSGSSSRDTILCVTNGCHLRSRGPKVRCLSGLGAHTNLEWAWGCASTLESALPLLSSSEGSWIAGKLTKLALNPEESVPGAACPWGGEHEGDRAPACPCLAYLSLHTSELTIRSAGQFRPRRQGRGHGGYGTVAFLVQCKLPVCWR